jgi:hypothetical protein
MSEFKSDKVILFHHDSDGTIAYQLPDGTKIEQDNTMRKRLDYEPLRPYLGQQAIMHVFDNEEDIYYFEDVLLVDITRSYYSGLMMLSVEYLEPDDTEPRKTLD